MSIGEMTQISHVLFAASIISAAAAVILFFAFDIMKCLKMMPVKHFRSRKEPVKTAGQKNTEADKAKNRKNRNDMLQGMATQRLEADYQ